MSEQIVIGKANAYTEIVRRTQAQHRLLSVHWELTYRCNERCTHCYLDVMAPGAQVPGELSTEEAKRVVDDLAQLGGLSITFSGGEVFLRPDIFDISRYARKKGFAIRYFTNAIGIKPSIADEIAAIKPVVVEISVYGMDSATHDVITKVPGSFDLTMRGLRLLRDRGVRCLIKTVVMKENIHQISDMQQWAREMDIGFQYDLTIVPKHTGDQSPLKHRPTDDQMLHFLRDRVNPENWKIHEMADDYSYCGIGMNSLTISPYGEVMTCVGARVSAGNVRDGSLLNMWRESPVWEETANFTLGNLPVCVTCELRQFCVRCHGTAAFEDGDMLGCSSTAYREARMRRQAYLENARTEADTIKLYSYTAA